MLEENKNRLQNCLLKKSNQRKLKVNYLLNNIVLTGK